MVPAQIDSSTNIGTTRRDATSRDATRRDATRRDATRRDKTKRDTTKRDADIKRHGEDKQRIKTDYGRDGEGRRRFSQTDKEIKTLRSTEPDRVGELNGYMCNHHNSIRTNISEKCKDFWKQGYFHVV